MCDSASSLIHFCLLFSCLKNFPQFLFLSLSPFSFTLSRSLFCPPTHIQPHRTPISFSSPLLSISIFFLRLQSCSLLLRPHKLFPPSLTPSTTYTTFQYPPPSHPRRPRSRLSGAAPPSSRVSMSCLRYQMLFDRLHFPRPSYFLFHLSLSSTSYFRNPAPRPSLPCPPVFFTGSSVRCIYL